MTLDVREAAVVRAAPESSTKKPKKLLGVPFSDLLWLAIPVAFSLWALRTELSIVPYPNDSALHQQMVRWATAMIEAGRSPLTGWYPFLQMGSAHFAHYQSLPHILTAYLGQLIGPERAFHITLYLLLSLWPVSVYVTARLFCLKRSAALIAAFIAPFVVSVTAIGFEWTSYLWGGPGVWSQLWAMMLVGPAMALSWRAVKGTGSIALASAMFGLTVAMHFQTGYMALISLAVWVLVAPSQLWQRLWRGTLVGLGALLAAAWVIVPLIRDNNWLNRTVADARVDHDSYGAGKVLGWLVSGELFDGRRWPVLTVVGAAGIAFCVRRFRKDETARILLGLFVFMLLLFCGRPTLGPLLKLLPGSDDFLLSRFIAGVHLAGILIIGVGGAWLAEGAKRFAGRLTSRERILAAPVAAVLMLVVLAAPVGERTLYALRDREWLLDQSAAERAEGAQINALIETAKRMGGGRIYSGDRMGWGDDYQVGFVSGTDRLADQDADQVGLWLRTAALSSDIETAFDESNPAHYDLLNVRYLIYPEDRKPAVPASFLARSGRHVLWEVQTSGYLKVIDTTAPIEADNRTILAANEEFLASDELGRGVHPLVTFPGVAPAEPTLTRAEPAGPPGRITKQFDSALTGSYGGDLQMERRGVAMLKSSFDGGWTATVDGKARPTFMVAPTFVGVEVGPGKHQVRFEYRSSTNYPLLFLIGALALATLHFVQRRGLPYYGVRRRKVTSR